MYVSQICDPRPRLDSAIRGSVFGALAVPTGYCSMHVFARLQWCGMRRKRGPNYGKERKRSRLPHSASCHRASSSGSQLTFNLATPLGCAPCLWAWLRPGARKPSPLPFALQPAPLADTCMLAWNMLKSAVCSRCTLVFCVVIRFPSVTCFYP